MELLFHNFLNIKVNAQTFLGAVPGTAQPQIEVMWILDCKKINMHKEKDWLPRLPIQVCPPMEESS